MDSIQLSRSKKAALPLLLVVRAAGQQVAHVVRQLAHLEVDAALHRVGVEGLEDGLRRVALGRHEGQPVEDTQAAVHVVVHGEVRHAVGVHDLRTAQLHVTSVHLAT